MDVATNEARGGRKFPREYSGTRERGKDSCKEAQFRMDATSNFHESGPISKGSTKMGKTIRLASCACGAVRCEGIGAPIASAVCYCSDCQEGGRRIEALPGAPRVLEADGGASYLTYRDDRFRCVSGAEMLVAHRLSDRAPTRRMVASCCNSGMFVKFEPGFWISSYRLRFSGALPPIEMHNQTRDRRAETSIPSDAPSFSRFPMRLFAKLIRARLEMLFGL
jgi:hypothetical protein